MSGVCSIHFAARKGICYDCGGCRKCPPLEDCRNRGCHVTTERGRRSTTTKNQDDQSQEDLPNPKRRKNSEVDVDGISSNDGSEFCPTASVITTPTITTVTVVTKVTNRSILSELFQVLGISNSGTYERFPRLGLPNIQKNVREFYTATKLLDLVVDAVCDIITQTDDDAFYIKEKYKKITVADNNTRVMRSLLNMALHGCRSTSLVANAILAKGMTNSEVQQLIDSADVQTTDNNGAVVVAQDRLTVGKLKFKSARKTYDVLVSGRPLPKYNYSFRVPAEKVSQLVMYLQSTLQVKPGITREVNIAGHVFHALPVYERGGTAIRDLFNTYVNAFPEKETRVGEPTFRDVVKLITKRGESKAGLSTFYIKLRYASQTFSLMLRRLQELACFEDNSVIVDGAKTLATEWEEHFQFLQYSYANQHLSIESEDLSHCCYNAVGAQCDHAHNIESCALCAELSNFFGGSVLSFLEEIAIPTVVDRSVLPELKTMLSAVPILQTTLRHYAAHRLRAKVQFYAIDKIKQDWLRERHDRVLVVVDH
jgi:hypothetical protein